MECAWVVVVVDVDVVDVVDVDVVEVEVEVDVVDVDVVDVVDVGVGAGRTANAPAKLHVVVPVTAGGAGGFPWAEAIPAPTTTNALPSATTAPAAISLRDMSIAPYRSVCDEGSQTHNIRTDGHTARKRRTRAQDELLVVT